MKYLSIVGARPQFVKLAPLDAALRQEGLQHAILHTGQHYDPSMSDDFFRLMSIPTPAFSLGIGSGTHGAQTGKMLEKIETVLVSARPEVVIVYGDTNSTLAGALAASKLGLYVCHVEAGLRSFNRRMPEEQNRVATDHLSDVLMAPTRGAMINLFNEGLNDRSLLAGDVMTDVCMATARRTDLPAPDFGSSEHLVLATIHRPSNTDSAPRLRAVLEYLSRLEADVIIAAHPRLLAKLDEFGISIANYDVSLRSPLSYPEMIWTLQRARAVVTDSGGLQKEAYLLGCPCTTLRSETEWPETLESDANILDADLTRGAEVLRAAPSPLRPKHFGDGSAAKQMAAFLATV